MARHSGSTYRPSKRGAKTGRASNRPTRIVFIGAKVNNKAV